MEFPFEKFRNHNQLLSWKIGILIFLLAICNICNFVGVIYFYSTALTEDDILDTTWTVRSSTLQKESPRKIPKRILFLHGLHRFDTIQNLELDKTGLEILGGYCNYSCEFTNNISFSHQFDAIVLDGRISEKNSSMTPILKTLFGRSNPNLMTVFFLMEPPQDANHSLEAFRNFFSLTMTYRTDSDIYVPFGRLVPIRKEKAKISFQNHLLAKRSKKVAWISSQCETPGRREKLVKDLAKSIPVHIYGKCGSLSCKNPHNLESCFEELGKTYKFYLSFESSFCADYVTENFFLALKYGMVPVVYGGGNYSRLAPDGAFIYAMSFPSMERLAKYLLKLDTHDDLYLKYFEWRRNFRVENISAMTRALCSLCEKLSIDGSSFGGTFSAVKDLNYWWNHHQDFNACQKPLSTGIF